MDWQCLPVVWEGERGFVPWNWLKKATGQSFFISTSEETPHQT